LTFAVELFPDPLTDRRVRNIWSALDGRGVASAGALPGWEPHPHVSLSAFRCEDVRVVADALTPVLAVAEELPLSLSFLGFFPTPVAPAFLGVTPTAALARLHRAVHEIVARSATWIGDHYLPDALVPHCTLAVGVADLGPVTEVLSGFTLPITGRLVEARLVELPAGREIASFRLGSGKVSARG
jgi:hypothetical protein